MSRLIPLSHGKQAIVDECDYESLACFKWMARKTENTWYAEMSFGKRCKIFMHRLILDTNDGLDTDHKDGNGLNNTRDNLRICSRRQNRQNQIRLKKDKTSRFKGVHWHTGAMKWQARIASGKLRSSDNRRTPVSLGMFSREEDAAMAYDQAAKIAFGEFASINF